MKTWLKWGIIGGLGITVICFIITIINNFDPSHSCVPTGFIPYSIWFYPTIFVVNILFYFSDGFWIHNITCINILEALIGIIFWFILGFIIGGIIGKVKSNKKRRIIKRNKHGK